MKAIFLVLIAISFFQSTLQNKDCEPGVFDVKIFIDQEEAIDAQFNAKLLKLASGDSQRGWLFEISSPNDLVNSIFVKSGDNYYLAYRSLPNTFEGNARVGEGNSISTTFSSDLKENVIVPTHSIRVQFGYDPDWSVVAQKDFAKIVELLNLNRVERINYVRSLKIALSIAASNFVTNQTNSDLSGKSKEEVDAKIAELKQKIEELRNNTNASEVECNETLADYRTNEDNIQVLRKDLSDKEGNLVQLNGQLNSEKSILNDLKTAKQTNTFNREKFQSTANNALQAISGLITTYREDAAADAWYLDRAFKNLQSFKVLKDFDEDVRKALLP